MIPPIAHRWKPLRLGLYHHGHTRRAGRVMDARPPAGRFLKAHRRRGVYLIVDEGACLIIASFGR
jgi:hypothetical protein